MVGSRRSHSSAGGAAVAVHHPATRFAAAAAAAAAAQPFTFPGTASLDAPADLDADSPFSAALAGESGTGSEAAAAAARGGPPPVLDVLRVDGRQAPTRLVEEVLHLLAGAVSDPPHPTLAAVESDVREHERKQQQLRAAAAKRKTTHRPTKCVVGVRRSCLHRNGEFTHTLLCYSLPLR